MTRPLLIASLLSAGLMLLATPGAASEIYKTVDENGRIIYTDRPAGRPGEKVTLPPVNTVPRETPQYTPQPRRAPAQEQAVEYEVSIVSPQNNADVLAAQRDLAIAVNLNRPLAQGHSLLFMMNGELLEETRNNSIMVREITRGAHNIHVEVIDDAGNSLASSSPVTVNVHRPIVRNRPAN